MTTFLVAVINHLGLDFGLVFLMLDGLPIVKDDERISWKEPGVEWSLRKEIEF